MKPIEELFHVRRAISGMYNEYEPGATPYIGNDIANNGVVGYVEPQEGDAVFNCRAVVVSAFCEATVQLPPFIACGRAGNGLVVLEPREAMPLRQLAYIAAYINKAVRWRFSWHRQTTADRLRHLLIPDDIPDFVKFNVGGTLPETVVAPRPEWRAKFRRFVLDEICDLVPGEYHSLSALVPGKVPVVSCTEEDNGVAGYYDVRNALHACKLTIAFNGTPLATKYHPYTFAAKDDVAVCIPRQPFRVSTEVFLGMMLNRERWRYSYYRKCFLAKLRRFVVLLPAKNGGIDEDAIQAMVETSPYWAYLHGRVTSACRLAPITSSLSAPTA